MSQTTPISTGAVDVRVIVPRVQALAERMEDWERRSGSAFEYGEYAQRHTAEQTERTTTQAVAALNRAREDMASAESVRRELERWRERCSEAMRRVQQAQAVAARAQAGAIEAVNHWLAQLEAARFWMATAQAAERQAEAARDQAEAALRQARVALENARNELTAARARREYAGTDKQGKPMYRPIDCSPHEGAVSQAEARASTSEALLTAAETELQQRRGERQRAEQRVHACTEAAHLAEQSRTAADEALGAASRAGTSVEHALEEQARSAKLTTLAQDLCQQELSMAEESHRQASLAREHESAARLAFSKAEQAQSDARQRSTQGRLEIEWRLDQLRAFDASISVLSE